MTASITLPRSVEGLTAEWLTSAIRTHCPDITVTSAATGKIIWGTSTKVLMDLQYEGDYRKYGLPEKICVKGEFDERMREAFKNVQVTGTQIEADFYNDMGPKLGELMPRYWFGGSEPGMGILILDNLAEQRVTFGAPTEPWSPELVQSALEILAALHGLSWGKSYPQFEWLQVGSVAVRQYTEQLFAEQRWREHFSDPGVFQMPKALADRERNLRGLRAMWKYSDERANCVVHGDAHIGNTFIDKAGRPYFIDWAGPCISNWAIDVSYFVAGTLTVEDRRHTEKDLINSYLKKLTESGGPNLEWEQAWMDYRMHHLHGLGWSTLPPSMQAREYVFAMGERHTTAIIDHETLKLLGV